MIFSFLLLGIVALIVSVLLAIPFALLASRIARRKALKHRQLIVIAAAVTPALFIGMEIVFGLIGSVYVSEKKGVDLGILDSFADVGATIADYLGVKYTGAGKSFLGRIE